MTITLGIDPGINGGLVMLSSRGGIMVGRPMPKRRGKTREMIDWERLERLLVNWATLDIHCAIEKQRPFASLDKNNRPQVMNSTGTMLENYGILKKVLMDVGIEFTEINPQTWKAAYRTKQKKRTATPFKKGESEAERKVSINRVNKKESTRMADLIWNTAAVTCGKDWTSGVQEAALIAEYFRRQQKQIALEKQL